MSQAFASAWQFMTLLFAGDLFDKIIFVIIVILAIILLVVALYVAWKLIVLAAKGVAWLFSFLFRAGRRHGAARREARAAAPPEVAVGWGAPGDIGLRTAFAEARRLVLPDAFRILVLSGGGMPDLCRGLGLTPPGLGTVGIAAGRDVVLIDASRAGSRLLRKLAATLPWRRPVDAVVSVVSADAIPPDTLSRAASFARASGLRVALHLVLPTPSVSAAWRVIEPGARDGASACSDLSEDAARTWLVSGSREGLNTLARAQSQSLPVALDRFLSAAPTSSVDVASLSFGGAGLLSAVAQTAARTRPSSAPGFLAWLGAGVLVAGIVGAATGAFVGSERARDLGAAVDTARRETSTAWAEPTIAVLPNGARVRRMAGVAVRLSSFSEFWAVSPLALLHPQGSAPKRFGSAILDAYVLRPLAQSLDGRARRRLAPSTDPEQWLDDARVVGEWLAAWDGLSDDPSEVDLRKLLSSGFGGDADAWPEGVDEALIRSGVVIPGPASGGLDTEGLAALARERFVRTMQLWADSVYTDGPAARAARRAVARGARWRDQHRALLDLRTALQDPAQHWLTSSKDRPDYGFELDQYGRAIALAVLGQTVSLEAKAQVSRIRIDARADALRFVLPDIGPLMTRSSGGSGQGGPSLTLSKQAGSWLSLLDRLVSADLPAPPNRAVPTLEGPVTADAFTIAALREKLRRFDSLVVALPSDLPAEVSRALLVEVAAEVVLGVASELELALRPVAPGVPSSSDAASLRLAGLSSTLAQIEEIEEWLLVRGASDAADRVLSVRARIAAGVLETGLAVLDAEAPLEVYLDPASDPGALVRRFERGLSRMRALYDRYAAPYLDAALVTGSSASLRWRSVRVELATYDRGDPLSSLSAIEGLLGAYRDDPSGSCEAPLPSLGRYRSGDASRALFALRSDMEDSCHRSDLARLDALYDELAAYYDRHIAWHWPFSADPSAPELGSESFSALLAKLHAAGNDVARTDGPLTPRFVALASRWVLDDGRPTLRLRIVWGARPAEETLAHHLMMHAFEGLPVDDAGVASWAYGSPVALRLRLARNSPLRFTGAASADGRDFVVAPDGAGSLLRLLSDLVRGAFSVTVPVIDDTGAERELRVTARVTVPDGAPLDFSASALAAFGFADFPSAGIALPPVPTLR